MKRAWTGLLAGMLVLAGCGDDEAATTPITAEPVTETTTTVEQPTTSTTEDPTAAIEQAYYDQWDAFVEILSDPDPANPLIDQHFAGPAKEKLLDSISSLARDGRAVRLPDDPGDFDPQVLRIDLEGHRKATVVECTVDGLVVFDRASGDVVNDRVSMAHVRNAFELIDGRWKVTSTTDPLPEDPPCDGR